MEQIAIYLRLSKEDEFVKDESNSIINQRAFIRGFINKNKELRKMSVVEFVDDGYSGKNMPGYAENAGTGEKKADFMRYCKGFFQIFQRSYRAGKVY